MVGNWSSNGLIVSALAISVKLASRRGCSSCNYRLLKGFISYRNLFGFLLVLVVLKRPGFQSQKYDMPMYQVSPNYNPRARCGPRSHFILPAKPFCQWWKHNIQCLRKFCRFGRMQYILQQSHCLRRPALDMFCITLCIPRTKTFVDPAIYTSIIKFCAVCFWIRDNQRYRKTRYISARNKSMLYRGLSHVQL